MIEEKTIQKAAKRVGTVHSNISLQIQALEKEIGVELFEKKGKNLIPNEYALDFYQSAKKTLLNVEELFTIKAKVLKEKNENLIRIAGHSYALSHLLPKYFKELIEINPNVKFELHNVTRDEGLNLLDKDLVDFIAFPFLPEHYANADIEIFDFYKCEFGIAVYKGHPLEFVAAEDLTWEMILKYDYLTLGKNITAQGLNRHSTTSRFTLINGTWEIGYSLVVNGLTISGADKGYGVGINSESVVRKINKNLLPSYRFSVCKKKSQKNNLLFDLIKNKSQS